MLSLIFFFFNDTATTEIYTLSLHDALPISPFSLIAFDAARSVYDAPVIALFVAIASLTTLIVVHRLSERHDQDRKSTRLNSSHQIISYAVFCLKKKIQSNTPAMFASSILCF